MWYVVVRFVCTWYAFQMWCLDRKEVENNVVCDNCQNLPSVACFEVSEIERFSSGVQMCQEY